MVKKQNPVTTFRCPSWIKKMLDRKVAEVILNNSNINGMFKYTRTDLILESILHWNKFVETNEKG